MRSQDEHRSLWVTQILLAMAALGLAGAVSAGEEGSGDDLPLEDTPWALPGPVDDDGQTLPPGRRHRDHEPV